MTALRRQTVFAGLDQPRAWPRDPRAPQPRRLDAALDALPGVGPTLEAQAREARARARPRPARAPAAPLRVRRRRGRDRRARRRARRGRDRGRGAERRARRRRGRLTIVTARVADGTATITATWFNQPWLADQLAPGARVRLRGKPGRYGFDVKSYDLGDGDATADFAPVYPASEEITPKRMRALVDRGAGARRRLLRPAARGAARARGLPLQARRARRAPPAADLDGEAEAGRRRLAFEELLLLQIGIARRAARARARRSRRRSASRAS